MNPKLALERMKVIYRSPEYWNQSNYGTYLADEQIRLKNAPRNWKVASRFLPSRGRLLDIGCATGFFGAIACKSGYDVIGIDPADDLVEFGRTRYGLDLRVSTVEESSFEPDTFDVISLWGTDSHFYDVRSGFSKIAEWLKPGGHFLFSYQDYSHWIRRFFPRIKQESNVYYNFTKTSCHLMMRQLRFAMLSERTAVQTTRVGRPLRTLGVRISATSCFASLKIALPTVSYLNVVARKL